MPELPEVETVARQLDPLLRGRRVTGVSVRDARLEPLDGAALHGARVRRVTRRGKQVVISLRRGGRRLYLVVHLRMTGRLLAGSGTVDAREPHLRALIRLGEMTLRFVDTRRFGTISLVRRWAETAPRGVEPLSSRLTAAALGRLLAGSRQPLKPWLLRQDRLVGLGNIYASEILFAARLSPTRPAGDLAPREVRRLHRALRSILRAAIDRCGTTFSDFQDARGVSGSFQELLRVYGRAGAPCTRCGAPIARLVQGQRSTFWCPRCQNATENPRRRTIRARDDGVMLG